MTRIPPPSFCSMSIRVIGFSSMKNLRVVNSEVERTPARNSSTSLHRRPVPAGRFHLFFIGDDLLEILGRLFVGHLCDLDVLEDHLQLPLESALVPGCPGFNALDKSFRQSAVPGWLFLLFHRFLLSGAKCTIPERTCQLK